MYATGCTLNPSKSLLISGNIAHTMGTVYFSHGSLFFNSETEVSENYGSLMVLNSNVIFLGTMKIIKCMQTLSVLLPRL